MDFEATALSSTLHILGCSKVLQRTNIFLTDVVTVIPTKAGMTGLVKRSMSDAPFRLTHHPSLKTLL